MPIAPVRDYYNFIGWHTDRSGNDDLGEWFGPNDPVIITKTVYAQWETFTPVTGITGIPDTIAAGVGITLNGIVAPSYATNRNIIWSVQNVGTTEAEITNGNVLTANEVGTVIIRATIVNGYTTTTNFVRDFTITVTDSDPTHTITVVYGTLVELPDNPTTGNFEEGETVRIVADQPPAGKRFVEWVVVSPANVTLVYNEKTAAIGGNAAVYYKPTYAETSFIMPNHDITIEARFEHIIQLTSVPSINYGTDRIRTPARLSGTLSNDGRFEFAHPPDPNSNRGWTVSLTVTPFYEYTSTDGGAWDRIGNQTTWGIFPFAQARNGAPARHADDNGMLSIDVIFSDSMFANIDGLDPAQRWWHWNHLPYEIKADVRNTANLRPRENGTTLTEYRATFTWSFSDVLR